MSEEPGKYITQDLTDALEMMGKGYNEPATVIEPPRKTLRRKKGEDFEEHESPAWIKFSTAFKDELPEIGGNALKVWIYIALSVNYHGEAFPGIMTIAKGIGLSHPTVIDAIHELEALNMLTVRRENRKANIYSISNEYVAVGRTQLVKKFAQSEGTMKEGDETMQISGANYETRIESNKRELEVNKNGADAPNFSEPLPVDWQIATDQKTIALPSQEQEWQAKVDIALMGICRYGADLEGLARAFIDGRRILPSKRELKGWAAAFREMKTAGVGANDIIQALGKLNDAGLTIADPWGVKKTAISLAIKSPFEQQQEVIW